MEFYIGRCSYNVIATVYSGKRVTLAESSICYFLKVVHVP